MKTVLRRPTVDLVAEACKEFEKENLIIEQALKELFNQFPGNSDLSHVLLKVVALNRLMDQYRKAEGLPHWQKQYGRSRRPCSFLAGAANQVVVSLRVLATLLWLFSCIQPVSTCMIWDVQQCTKPAPGADFIDYLADSQKVEKKSIIESPILRHTSSQSAN
jgi:hypothetical protein